MPQLIDNGDGTHTQIADNGTRSIVVDPTGSYGREIGSKALGIAGTVAGTIPGVGVLAGPALTAASGAMAPPPAGAPQPAAPLAPTASPEMTPPPEVLPGGPVAPETRTSTTSSHGTSGPDAASKALLLSRGEKAYESEKAAGTAAAGAATTAASRHETEATQAMLAGYTKEAGAMAAQQKYGEAYDAAMQEAKDARKKPIDVKEAFGDDRGAYAFLATMGAALANVGRAWMGQAMQPITVIDDLVNRSVKLQMDRRGQLVDAAHETADQQHQYMLDAKARAYEGAKQQADARVALAKSKDEADAAGALSKALEAKADEANFEKAKSVASQATSQVGTTTITKSGGTAGPSLAVPGEQADATDQRVTHDEIARALPDLKPEQRIAQWNKFHDKALNTERLRSATQKALHTLDAAAPEAAKGKGQSVSGQGLLEFSNGRFASKEANDLYQDVKGVVENAPLAKGMKRLSKEDIENITGRIMAGKDYHSIKRGIESYLGEADEADRSLHSESPGLYRLHHYLQGRQHERTSGGANLQAQEAQAAARTGGSSAPDAGDDEGDTE